MNQAGPKEDEKQEGASPDVASPVTSPGPAGSALPVARGKADGVKSASASSRARAASPQRKARPAQKKPAKSGGGGEIASPRQQVGQGTTKPEMQRQYRKLEQMEKIATKTKKMPSESSGDTATPAQPPVQELVAPHEWDMLLHAFEENGMTPTSQSRSAPGQIEIDAEDLWEKLSSTRWLKAHKADESSRASTTTSPDDPSNKTTVANR